MPVFSAIETAHLVWEEGGPRNTDLDDRYFASEGGLAEARYVFIQQNNLAERFAHCQQFTVAETGFGTGLNFLATVEVFQRVAPVGARLDFVSVERSPLTKQDLETALSAWPELAELASKLLAVYPPAMSGFHRVDLFEGRVALTLMLGDAVPMFSLLDAQVDAWFLDGFAPSKNPDMWSEALFGQVSRLSRVGATFATFTAAGHVRRALEAVGFDVRKFEGFGRKREMLCGEMRAPQVEAPALPWFHPPAPVRKDAREVVVIGAGVAGMTVAHTLARRGWRVTVCERAANTAQEASGNPAGIVLPRLTLDMNSEAQFYVAAFLSASRFYTQLQRRFPAFQWRARGVLQLLDDARAGRIKALGMPRDVVEILDKAAAQDVVGLNCSSGGLFFPQGGWLDPRLLCTLLREEAGQQLELKTCCSAHRLERSDGQWQVIDEAGEVVTQAPVVVLANGYAASRFDVCRWLPLMPVRGQLSYLAVTESSSRLKVAVCYEGYVIPGESGRHYVGATYDTQDLTLAVRRADHEHNLSALRMRLPDFTVVDPANMDGRVALRTATEDHLPCIGPVPDERSYMQQYADLSDGKPARNYPPATYHPGLYVSVGHGSRGLASSWLASEMIAAQLAGEPCPVPRDIAQMLHPGRFLVRRLRRGG